jgi:hypothetical protein
MSTSAQGSQPTPPPPASWTDTPEKWEKHYQATLVAALRVRELKAQLARDDPNVFTKYVLKDERTGKRIVQAPMHEEWQQLLGTVNRLVMWSHVEGGKTTQIAVGRTLWELGRDRSLRVVIVSNTKELATKMTRQVGQYIEKSPELHEVFPDLLPTNDPSLPWRALQLTVRRPGLGAKDPSVQACGVHGNIIGARIDLLILDDILDYENTHTPGPRDDVWRWVRSTLFSRLTEKARVWCVGNAWHPDDPMHRMEKEEGFTGVRFPVIKKDGSLTWPANWTPKRIDQARRDLGPFEFARQMLCQARDDTSHRFKREWVDQCIKAGADELPLENASDVLGPLAEGSETEEEFQRAVETVRILQNDDRRFITGVDLAVQRGDSNDLTCLFTLYVEPDGTRRVAECLSGRWTGPEIINKIRDVHRRFGSIFVIENNAAQDYILQFTRGETAIPVVPFTTGRNKAHPEYGVEGLAVEMSNLKWRIPSRGGLSREMHEWCQELLYYDPKEHTGDRLMASWFAREGARRFCDGVGASTGSVAARTF